MGNEREGHCWNSNERIKGCTGVNSTVKETSNIVLWNTALALPQPNTSPRRPGACFVFHSKEEAELQMAGSDKVWRSSLSLCPPPLYFILEKTLGHLEPVRCRFEANGLHYLLGAGFELNPRDITGNF